MMYKLLFSLLLLWIFCKQKVLLGFYAQKNTHTQTHIRETGIPCEFSFPFFVEGVEGTVKIIFFDIHMHVIYFSQGNENENFAKNLLTPIFSPLTFQHTVWIFTPIFPTQSYYNKCNI